MAEKLLTKASNKLLESGFEQTETTHQNKRSTEIRHTVFTRDGEFFQLGAKDYVYKGLASFGVKQVERAKQHDGMLVLYIGKRDEYYVFDPAFADKNGKIISGDGKQVSNRDWLNIPMEHGVTLSEYIKGTAEVDTLAGNNETLGSFA